MKRPSLSLLSCAGRTTGACLVLVFALLSSVGMGCSDEGGDGDGDSSGDGDGMVVENPLTDPASGPPAGWAEGACLVPAEGGLEDVSDVTTVVGDGSAESCTGQAFIDAVATGGVITFDCGDEPHTIMLTEPAKVHNDASDEVVIDGGGLITLSGSGTTRILYMNTCDESLTWTTPMCDNQDHPRLTVQNITFVDGSTTGVSGDIEDIEDEEVSGSAVYAYGGRFKAVNTRWFNNRGYELGPDFGGALRVMAQYNRQPAYIVNSTFGGQDGLETPPQNGGAISSISVDWKIYNSVFSYNSAVGNGGNPPEGDTPGGGSGGAIYNDGLDLSLEICGSLIENNSVNAYGEAIFFVSNDEMGTLTLTDSTVQNNCGGSWEPAYPSLSHHATTTVVVDDTAITDCE